MEKLRQEAKSRLNENGNISCDGRNVTKCKEKQTMKRKIIQIIITAAITLTAFFIGRNTVSIQDALENIQYYEVTDTGLDLYDYSGNLYHW